MQSSYDYYLPEELIAQSPKDQRDQSRLMVNHLEGGMEHRVFSDVLEYLNPGDVLVLNQSKVIPARLLGEKQGTGAKCEALLLKRLDADRWEALVRPGNKIRPGHVLQFGEELTAEVLDKTETGGRILRLIAKNEIYSVLDRVGQMPLPPYIKKKDNDPARYQTVYAKEPGSAAAPTAGLHFTPELLEKIRQKGVGVEKVTLHVGLGTFRPVATEDIREHHMHSEHFILTPDAAERINRAKQAGGRVIAVGTTSIRVLESAADESGILHGTEGDTAIFIYPGYRWKVVDGMVTNFHLPKSTLIMLVSAFMGRERTLSAYETAVKERYRFFSYGDAMLIL
ncbi:MAG: tRNA preQ1(34) S-adenosylmethionine ribosyltransferase-isomerase QueA [Clostridiales bacterium]|nr:tRNA preQ1(34) S-adenosylmethionine ribosyltransferase-isomerase QueA [Clostridiales bacterium]